ncbi:MAG TPA: protein kinase, partial [Byssovorax sp.]
MGGDDGAAGDGGAFAHTGRADDADDAAAQHAGALGVGVVLDEKYRLKSRLGRGGFGDVWRAEELLPDGAPFREVALKLLGSVDHDAGEWTEEAKLLASFRHTSLVTIYAAGILRDGTRFVAMEVLEGQNLAEVLRSRGRVPWRRALGFCFDAAGALDVIHARGVVHLDLKPANLFLCTDGGLKVLDFGIARQADAAPPSRGPARTAAELGETLAQIVPTLREPGSNAPLPPRPSVDSEALAATRLATRATDAAGRAVVGTPGFIAPEILRGRQPTPAADAYALAVCLAQLATGRLPHDAPDEPEDWNDASAVSAWLESVRSAAAEGALRALPELPAGLRALVARLCAAEPEARGVPAGGLAAAFGEVVRLPFGAPNPPYFGVAPFPASAEGVLFGRDDDVERLGRELAFEGCLVVQGARAVGKTSLVRVGLAPHAARTALDGMDDWRLVEIAPGDDPDAALRAALTAAGAALDDGDPPPDDDLGERIDRGTLDAEELEAWAAAERVGLMLFVDPLELAAAAAPERRARLEALAAALSRETFAGVRLVGALSDAFAADALATSLGAIVRAGVRFVGGPSPAAARDIAIGPAELAGAEITSPEIVVTEVEQELRVGAARVPLVALALSAWWTSRVELTAARASGPYDRASSASTTPLPSPAEPPTGPSTPLAHAAAAADGARRSIVEHKSSGKIVIRSGPSSPTTGAERVSKRGTASQRTGRGEGVSARGAAASARARRAPTARLSGERFRELGGVRGALTRHADATLAAAPPEARAVAETLLLRLSTTDGLPRVWRERDLLEACEAPDVAAVLGALEAAHLVVRRSGDVELAHPALAASWSRLGDLRLSRMEELGLLERLREAAATWEREGERRDLLLGAQQLGELSVLRRRGRHVGLTAKDAAFVAASQRAARRRRAVRAAGGLAAAFLVAAGLMSWRALEVARNAEEQAKDAALELEYTSDLAAKSRRATDPYARAAFAAEAMARGSLDAALPLELALTAARAPHAEFLTLERVADPAFFWDDRWLVAPGASGDLVTIDFSPREPEVYDDVDIELDPELAGLETTKRPRVASLRLFDAPIAEVVPFAFDTSFVARSIDGEVKVVRLRDAGATALVAAAPMRCVGPVHLARRAPILACATDHGIARWDVSRRGPPDHAKAEGAVEDIAADGARVVGRVTRKVFVWTPASGEESATGSAMNVSFARFSPDGAAVAVGAGDLRIVDAAAPKTVLFTSDLTVDAIAARWDPGGLDVGVCDASGVGAWTYLRKGKGRASDDPPPRGHPCRALGSPTRPDALAPGEKVDELAGKDVGGHLDDGGFRLSHDRVLSRDLVVFDVPTAAAASLLAFGAKDELGEEADEPGASGPSSVVRAGNVVAVQIGDEVRIYAAEDGSRYASRRGRLLGACPDGRLLAAQDAELGARVFDVWSNATAGWVRASPGLHFVGVEPSCGHAITQRMTGEIDATELRESDFGATRAIARPSAFVYDARPARAAPGLGAGLW